MEGLVKELKKSFPDCTIIENENEIILNKEELNIIISPEGEVTELRAGDLLLQKFVVTNDQTINSLRALIRNILSDVFQSNATIELATKGELENSLLETDPCDDDDFSTSNFVFNYLNSHILVWDHPQLKAHWDNTINEQTFEAYGKLLHLPKFQRVITKTFNQRDMVYSGDNLSLEISIAYLSTGIYFSGEKTNSQLTLMKTPLQLPASTPLLVVFKVFQQYIKFIEKIQSAYTDEVKNEYMKYSKQYQLVNKVVKKYWAEAGLNELYLLTYGRVYKYMELPLTQWSMDIILPVKEIPKKIIELKQILKQREN